MSWTLGLAFNWPRKTCEVGEAGGESRRHPHSEQGAVAQLGERLICIQEAVGSIPISSTSQPGL
jgi:hypothetical protein